MLLLYSYFSIKTYLKYFDEDLRNHKMIIFQVMIYPLPNTK